MGDDKNIQLKKLMERIPFSEVSLLGVEYKDYELILESLLEDSKHIAFEILYPYEDYPSELDKRYYNWQLRACVELYNLADKAGITNYSENGISWSKLNDGLSISLLNALTSRVGIPKRKVEESTEEGESNV